MFDMTPPKPPVIQICKKEIKLATCPHLTSKNVKEALVLYKIINNEDKIIYYGTCRNCYMENISRKHKEGMRDD